MHSDNQCRWKIKQYSLNTEAVAVDSVLPKTSRVDANRLQT